MNPIADSIAVAHQPPSVADLFGTTEVIAIAVVGGLVSWGVIQLVLWYCARNRAAVRGAEFHHGAGEAVPRFGGLAFAASFVVSGLALGFVRGWSRLLQPDALAIFMPATAMFVVGFWDDLRPLGARKKLALQIIVALLAYLLGLQVTTLKNPFTSEIYHLETFGIALTVLWLVGMTNLINLVDGVDGLAGGVSLMLMALLAFVGLHGPALYVVIAAALAGALVAFLRFNFPPARIYMGDGGAYFLGFLIGAMTIANSHKGTVLAALIAPVIALGLPIIDTAVAILRRGLNGLPLFRADRRHIHHRLMQRGLSRTRTVLLLYAISVVFLLLGFAFFWSEQSLVPIVFGMVFLIFLFAQQGGAMGLDWLAVGRSIGNSRAVRRHTQYAMALSCWLEMEAERTDSLDALWDDFTFMVRKTGFTHAKVVFSDSHRAWHSEDHTRQPARPEHVFEFNPGSRMMVLLQSNNPRMDERVAGHLSELVAEAWLKAVTRWSRCANQPLRFQAAPPDGPVPGAIPPAAGTPA